MKQSLVADILELSVAERLRLVEAIWDSIATAPQALPLTASQREELDRRLAEFEVPGECPEVVRALAEWTPLGAVRWLAAARRE